MKKIIILLLLAFVIVACQKSETTSQGSAASDIDSDKQVETVSLSSQQIHGFSQKGKFISQAAFGRLSQALLKTLNNEGPAAAMSYCKVAAYPLTDSMGQVTQSVIKRTSLNYRNPRNAPTAEEKTVLEAFASLKASGTPIEPVVKPYGSNSVTYYAPIMMLTVCQKCHGTAETLDPAVTSLITELYPEDKAVGYSEGDLRGMWSVRMEK